MARRASKVCPVPGCPELAPRGSRYCPEHTRAHHRDYNARRPELHRSAYGAEWRRIRDAFIAEHPYCETCGAPAEQVHHITPLSAGGTHDESNLQSLCHRCHSRVTARGGFGRREGGDG